MLCPGSKYLPARFLETAMIPKILSAVLILYVASSSWGQSLDLVIRNGSVLDGSGSPAKQVDIGIRGDRVVLIGKSLRQKASRVIDAHGLMVAPGFIDPHTHTFEDLSNPATSRNDAYLMQGVTTVVTMTEAARYKLVMRYASGLCIRHAHDGVANGALADKQGGVGADARISADLNLIWAICRPRQTPQIAGSKKRSRQNRDNDSMRNLARQNTQGAKDKAALTRTVRRDIDPMTNPPIQDHAIKRKRLHSSNVKPGPTVSPVALKMVGWMSR